MARWRSENTPQLLLKRFIECLSVDSSACPETSACPHVDVPDWKALTQNVVNSKLDDWLALGVLLDVACEEACLDRLAPELHEPA